MFAGDNFKPAANASYRNLLWENFHVDHSFDIGTKIQKRDKEIGTIDSWGPFFRVSFDLIIHSIDQNSEWYNVFSFLQVIGTENKVYLPAFDLYRSSLTITNDYFKKSHSSRLYRVDIEENHWYNIIFEQKSAGGKVIQF